MIDKPIKFDESSKLIITIKVGEQEVQNVLTGEVFTRDVLQEVVCDEEISLGSINNPNNKILKYRYDVPAKDRNFFRGGKK